VVTRKARRRERYAQDPDYRARQRAQCRAYYNAHKEEINARSRAYYHAHKKDIQPLLRRGALKRLYGISPAEYEVLLAKQGGVCATCGKSSKKTLCVDHCHATGTIRGLLCGKCNTGFGCFKDSQAAMMAAIAYLGGSKGERTGAAAQRALAARAAMPAGRARMILEVEPYRPDRCAAAPPGRSAGIGGGTSSASGAKRPMWDALSAELGRERDDGAGNKAGILQLIVRKLAAKALEGDLAAIKEIFDRMEASRPLAHAR
jgi:hypothetical protein